MRAIKRLIVHHSASPFGDTDLIDEWHRARGWAGVGYHHIILNGRRHCSLKYHRGDDGLVETGRPHAQQGAHAGRVGANHDSIGICLIGNQTFTRRQFCELIWLLRKLNAQYGVGIDGVLGHGELDPLKALCPGFNMELLRAAVSVAADKEDRHGDHVS